MRPRLFLFLLLLLLNGSGDAIARVRPQDYGLEFSMDSTLQSVTANKAIDSLVERSFNPAKTPLRYAIPKLRRERDDRTVDFYLLLSLVLLLGGIRSADPKYFFSLLRSFRNPSGTDRIARDGIQSAVLPNLLMNLFFGVTAAAFIYYLLRLYGPAQAPLAPGMLLLSLSGGMVVIYLLKYGAMRFTGWAFRVEEVTDQYLFNVFLINKMIGMALLPFVVMLAFFPVGWAGPVVIVSLVVTGLLIINRYTRSWSVFGSFFQYSRFHFFTYLCASEILPLAILLKLLLRNWG